MAEKSTVYSSKITYNGVFSFADFYKFCYDWLTKENSFFVLEKKYKEKIQGDAKNLQVIWKCTKEVTDYFNFELEVRFQTIGLKSVEVMQGNKKVKTNKGMIEITVVGTLVHDPKGKFETTAFQKFLRGLYEKMVLNSRLEQMEEKIVVICEGFLGQAKAFLDLEGKK